MTEEPKDAELAEIPQSVVRSAIIRAQADLLASIPDVIAEAKATAIGKERGYKCGNCGAPNKVKAPGSVMAQKMLLDMFMEGVRAQRESEGMTLDQLMETMGKISIEEHEALVEFAKKLKRRQGE